MTAPPNCIASIPDDKRIVKPGPINSGWVDEVNVGSPVYFQRKCGCLRTSDKLKKVLGTFPSPPPPTPISGFTYDKASGYNYGHTEKQYMSPVCCTGAGARKMKRAESKSWRIVTELVTLVQLSVTATALALYYLIYCYMQLVYYILRSALYFHNADGPMKVTIGVVTVTSLIVGFNILLRMERIIGIVY